MRTGTIAVREALGDGVPGVTDKDIQEALWHYYYDVEKSVNYLIQSRMPKEEKKKKVKGGQISLSCHFSGRHNMVRGEHNNMSGRGHGLGGGSPQSTRGMKRKLTGVTQLRDTWMTAFFHHQQI